MASKTIAWTTGGGNITLSYSGQGNGSVSVSSSQNDSFEARSQSIYLSTTLGSPAKNIAVTITQQGKSYNPGDVFNFDYTGTVQSVELPKGKYKLQCWGAQGGTSYGSPSAIGSKGGYSEGVLILTETTTLYVFVGGKGSRGSNAALVNGGWNGGGASVGFTEYNTGEHNGWSYPACGGGATDIATVTSSMSYSNGRTNRSTESLLSRFIVAGGGAGASYQYTEIEEEVTEEVENVIFSECPNLEYDYPLAGGDAVYSVRVYISAVAGRTYYASYDAYTSMSYYVRGFYTIADTSTGMGSFIGGTSYTATEDMEIMFVYLCREPDGTTPDGYVCIDITESYTDIYINADNYDDYTTGNQQGGGVKGAGYNPGTQSSAGSVGNTGNNGGFGYGANQTVQHYRYASGGAGGGWYGGATRYSDTDPYAIHYTGGGSGFVNTAANAGYRPNGYTGLQLESGSTIAGNTSHPSVTGGDEVGHSGNGYARITVL